MVWVFSESVYDPKVPKARLAVLGNQDIVLNVQLSTRDVDCLLVCLPDGCCRVKYQTDEDASGLGTLGRANVGGVSRLSSPVFVDGHIPTSTGRHPDSPGYTG